MRLTVAVAEGREVVRRGLEVMLQSIPGVSQRAYATVEELVTHAVETGWARVSLVSPQVLRSAGRDIQRRLARTPILATVPSERPVDVLMAAQAPADGYVLLSDLSVGSLDQALQDVASGRRHLPEQISSLLRRWERPGPAGDNGRRKLLSPREGEVMDLLVQGRSNKEISRHLGISIHGTKRHVSSILNKLDSPSRSHLVSSILRGALPDALGQGSPPRSNASPDVP